MKDNIEIIDLEENDKKTIFEILKENKHLKKENELLLKQNKILKQLYELVNNSLYEDEEAE